jgi:glycosyltransferase involved in cell wall biosynthesis
MNDKNINSQLKEKILIPEGVVTFLFFGQIKKVKGLDILIRAASNLYYKDTDHRFILLIAGKFWHEDKDYYLSLIENSGIKDKIISRFEFIPDDELPVYFSMADIVVLPYREIYQSGVLLLSMSYSKPVIASNIPGMSSIVEDGKNGWLFESESIEDLEKVLKKAIASRHCLRELGSNAKSLMDKNYDWIKIGKETINVYHSLIK